jgi:hypothetical protein
MTEADHVSTAEDLMTAGAGHGKHMTKTSDEDPQPSDGAPQQPRVTKPTRLSVNISTATAEALREVSRDKGVSMTEAVRRLVGYGIVVYRAVRDGGEVLIRRDDKAERLILLD